MRNLKVIKTIALVLLIIGGLNWLLFGVFDTNLVTMVLGDGTYADIVYILVGLSAVVVGFTHIKGGGSSESASSTPSV